MAKKTILYVPSHTVNNFVDVQIELRRIQEAFLTLAEHVATEVTTDQPGKEVNLQVRYADGVNWNPRGLGEGLYIFAGGIWNKITLS